MKLLVDSAEFRFSNCTVDTDLMYAIYYSYLTIGPLVGMLTLTVTAVKH